MRPPLRLVPASDCALRAAIRAKIRHGARLVLVACLVLGGSAVATATGLSPESDKVGPEPQPLTEAERRPTFTLDQFKPDAPLHIIAYGDSRFTDPHRTEGTNPRVRQWLAEEVGRQRPELLLLTGDTPFVGQSKADWQQFQKETISWKAAGLVVLPTTGNHETYFDYKAGIANYLANFPAIQGHLNYSAVAGPVEVISLDMTQAGDAHSAEYRWFAAQLDHVPATVKFIMVLYHVPWMADVQSRMVANVPSPNALTLRSLLESRLNRLHARVLVISGHIHNYERFERLGVEYLVTGGGGAEPYPILLRGRSDLYRDLGFPVYNYVTLTVVGNTLTGTMWKVKDPDAATLSVEAKDHFTLRAP